MSQPPSRGELDAFQQPRAASATPLPSVHPQNPELGVLPLVAQGTVVLGPLISAHLGQSCCQGKHSESMVRLRNHQSTATAPGHLSTALGLRSPQQARRQEGPPRRLFSSLAPLCPSRGTVHPGLAVDVTLFLWPRRGCGYGSVIFQVRKNGRWAG